MLVPWRKHWRLRESTPPTRRGSVGLACDAYHRAFNANGEDDPATRAAYGRLAAYHDEPPAFTPFSIEDVAYRRELGAHGALNRSRRREFDRRMKALENSFEKSNEERKRDQGERVLLERGPTT